jgi:hypothetical protein
MIGEDITQKTVAVYTLSMPPRCPELAAPLTVGSPFRCEGVSYVVIRRSRRRYSPAGSPGIVYLVRKVKVGANVPVSSSWNTCWYCATDDLTLHRGRAKTTPRCRRTSCARQRRTRRNGQGRRENTFIDKVRVRYTFPTTTSIGAEAQELDTKYVPPRHYLRVSTGC